MSQVILQLWANNAISLLQADIGASDTVLQLQPGLGANFPQPTNPGEFFLITLEDVAAPVQREIIKVMGRSGDNLTGLVRGWEGTTARAWSAGDTLVDHRITAGTVHQSFIYGSQDGGNVSALNALNSTGIYVVTSATTGATRELVGDSIITVTNGDGIAGNPTITLNTGNDGDVLTSVGGQAVWAPPVGGGGGGSLSLYAEKPVTPSAPSATGNNSVAIGQASSAEAPDSIAFGPQSKARLRGQRAYSTGRFSTTGDAQQGYYALRASTINNVPTTMFLDGVGGTEQLILPDDSTWTFKATVTAHRIDGSDGHAGFELKGVIYRGAGADTTAIQGKVSSQVIGRSNTSWNVSAAADPTSGALKLTVTGQNSKTIRWLAVVETVEVSN